MTRRLLPALAATFGAALMLAGCAGPSLTIEPTDPTTTEPTTEPTTTEPTPTASGIVDGCTPEFIDALEALISNMTGSVESLQEVPLITYEMGQLGTPAIDRSCSLETASQEDSAFVALVAGSAPEQAFRAELEEQGFESQGVDALDPTLETYLRLPDGGADQQVQLGDLAALVEQIGDAEMQQLLAAVEAAAGGPVLIVSGSLD